MISKKQKQKLSFFLKDKHRKNWLQIIKEFTALYFSKKEVPTYYITNLLYRKNVTNYKSYLSIKEENKLMAWSYSQARNQIVLAENKLLFEELMSKNNIPTPKIFFHNSKHQFTYNENVIKIENKKDFFLFLEGFFNEVKIQSVFCKPINGLQGQNIFILDKTTYRNLDDTLINLIFSQEFIFQEVISQHKSLNKINKFSVNTLRIITYKNKDNKVEILSGFIRLGRNGSIVDNASAGGIAVSFDKKTGKLRHEGLQLINTGGGIFYKHPDTEIIFDNFQIPYYTQVKEIVEKASTLFKFPLLGWDVAITTNGPVVVEVNHNFHLFFSDRMENGLKNNPTFNKLLQQIK